MFIIEGGAIGLPLLLVLLLRIGQGTQPAVPVRLQLIRHQSVIGIDLHVATAGEFAS